MNLMPSSHDGRSLVFGSTACAVDPAVAAQMAQLEATEVVLGVRPQGLELGPAGTPAEVVVVEELGSETFVFVELEQLGETIRVRVRVDAEYSIARGDRTHVAVQGPVHAFGPDGLRLKTQSEAGRGVST
jgi:multiple sugar transport system ATP-binding protein